MDYDFLEFVQHVEDDQVFLPIPRQILRDYNNPLEKFTNTELLQRYRFSRNTIQNVIFPLVYPGYIENNNRGLPIPPIIKLLTTLRFYATGSFQKTCGDLQTISQSSVCRIIAEVSEIISGHLGEYIKFSEVPEEIVAKRNLFFEIAGSPAVSGCVDGTHIEIKNPGGETAEYFRNRKSWMSLNIQVVAGPRCEILDIVIRWPGSAHDSRIFNSSAVHMRFEQHRLSGILLGDSAYPQLEYLFTPIQNPNTEAEQRFNFAHIRTHNVVERTFGIWKGRFRCLTIALNCKLRNTLRIIAASAVLHNIGISERDNLNIDENILGRAAFIRHFNNNDN